VGDLALEGGQLFVVRSAAADCKA